MTIESRGCWSSRTSTSKSSPSSKSRIKNERRREPPVWCQSTRQRAFSQQMSPASELAGSPMEPSGSGTVSEVVLKVRVEKSITEAETSPRYPRSLKVSATA